MTRIIWHLIKEKLIHPISTSSSFTSISAFRSRRDARPGSHRGGGAVKKIGVGVKCATINPRRGSGEGIRTEREVPLAQRHHPQHPRRRHLREPIICKNVPRLVPGWTKPIIIGRHAYGDQYRATDFRVPGKSKLSLSSWRRRTKIEREVFRFPAAA